MNKKVGLLTTILLIAQVVILFPLTATCNFGGIAFLCKGILLVLLWPFFTIVPALGAFGIILAVIIQAVETYILAYLILQIRAKNKQTK